MQKISIIGVPLDLGADRRGVDMGPAAIRYANVIEKIKKLGYSVEDTGDILVPTPRAKPENNKAKYLNEIANVSLELANRVSEKVEQGYFPLIFGGDHSISIGSIAGIAKHKKNLGVIWYDAHGDLNTHETTPSGNIHGMPLAVALGMGHPDLIQIGGFFPKIKPEHVVLIGIRDLDEPEKEVIKRLGIKTFTMHEIDRKGMAYVMEEALKIVTNGTDGVHLSMDLDALDPIYAPGVGTPVPGGLTYRESHLAMEILAEAKVLTSAEFVEVNPILGQSNITAKVAVELIGSALGEKLL